MNKRKIITITNYIGVISIFSLIYWIFIFINVNVFGLKIFRENLSELFELSILGILALMSGALILNIMMNLSIITEQKLDGHSNEPRDLIKNNKKIFFIFLISFPLIAGLLFIGDYNNTQKNKKHLIERAQFITHEYKKQIETLADHDFSSENNIKQSASIVRLFKSENGLLDISVLFGGKYQDEFTIFEVNDHILYLSEFELRNIYSFIYRCSSENRQYLKTFFDGGQQNFKFSAHDGNYELYFPVSINEKQMVLYLNKKSRYAK